MSDGYLHAKTPENASLKYIFIVSFVGNWMEEMPGREGMMESI